MGRVIARFGFARELLARSYDCLAVPLPPSFQEDVEAAIEQLPTISAVTQLDVDTDDDDESDMALGFSYVPIDPCQPVIAGLRLAMGERMTRAFIDLETPRFQASMNHFPDPYALKRVSPEGFAAAILPAIPPPMPGQHQRRIAHMARELHLLEARHKSILLVCSLIDWPWIKDAYNQGTDSEEPAAFFAPIQSFGVDPKTLIFLTGELPYLTGLYERGAE